MAEKSGLNITIQKSFERFLESFYDGQAQLHPISGAFQSRDVMRRHTNLANRPSLDRRNMYLQKQLKPLLYLRLGLQSSLQRGCSCAQNSDGSAEASVPFYLTYQMLPRPYIPTSQSWRLVERSGPSLALIGLERLGSPTKISHLRPLPRAIWPLLSIVQSKGMPNLTDLSNPLPFLPKATRYAAKLW